MANLAHFAISLLIVSAFHLSSSITFNFPNFPTSETINNITLEGDATSNGVDLQITSDVAKESWQLSTGRASYAYPMDLWNAKHNTLADFTTRFSFKINGTLQSGEGISFFIVPFYSKIPLNSFGPYLGLFNKSSAFNKTANQVVAVVFDTYKNVWDPEGDRVCIDINTVKPEKQVVWNGEFTDGQVVNALISYNSTTHNLSVFAAYENSAVLDGASTVWHVIDLRDVLPETVRVGFSAGTGYYFQTHAILSWEFTSNIIFPASSVPSSPTVSPQKGVDIVHWFYVGILVFVCFVSGLGLGMCYSSAPCLCRIKMQLPMGGEEDMLDTMSVEFARGTGPKSFTFAELKGATKNFSEEGKLGQGGFGGVYKGLLAPSNEEIAVKRIAENSKQGKKEYMSEVKIISELRHKNLVKLIGWCHENSELLLVYEYMPNGSLDSHLFGDRVLLTLVLRYKIALGLASALLYLHEDWEQCVLHRDIKSSNVMLDSEFNAKLGDFGLATFIDHELGSQATVQGGTLGYLAPECFPTGKSSKESDVYSFGVVVLEIASGRRAIYSSNKSPVEWIQGLRKEDKLLDAADEKLNMDFEQDQIKRLLDIGLWCCQTTPMSRPSIRQAMNALNFQAQASTRSSKHSMPMSKYTSPGLVHRGKNPTAQSSSTTKESLTSNLKRYIFGKKKAPLQKGRGDDILENMLMDQEFAKGRVPTPKKFTFAELSRATNNFSEEWKLGEEGFVRIYKGLLAHSKKEIAVKRIPESSKQGKKEYESEVKIISQLRHSNLVQLIGWCHERCELLLVYEYMPNGSLDTHLLYGGASLTWLLRYKVASGLASALLYLHEELEQCVVHRDVKSSNVMLDSEFNAKLGDLGLARFVDCEVETHVNFLNEGNAHLAPECVVEGKFSKESDVYSFGVVALEIACGRRAFEPMENPRKRSLVAWVWDLYGKDKLLDAADVKLNGDFDQAQIKWLMIVGLWCCHPDPAGRPSIREAIDVLNFQEQLPILPSKQPFIMFSY